MALDDNQANGLALPMG
jgi:hypothetical protein